MHGAFHPLNSEHDSGEGLGDREFVGLREGGCVFPIHASGEYENVNTERTRQFIIPQGNTGQAHKLHVRGTTLRAQPWNCRGLGSQDLTGQGRLGLENGVRRPIFGNSRL